jgi:tetratricopeptide (TPR) repeat protein
MRIALSFTWLPSVLACVGPARGQASRAQASEEVAARQEFELGREAYDHGSFANVLAHFERAYALQPRPELLYNVGRAADSDGRPGRAIEAYSSYLESNPDADNSALMRSVVARLFSFTKRLVICSPRARRRGAA